MKKIKLLTLIVSSAVLAACTNSAKIDERTPTKEDLVGNWSCQTIYEDLNVGVVDLISLKSDGSVYDESYVFDHSVNKMVEKPIKDYFSSPLKYLTIYLGEWKLENNDLTYSLKQKRVQRVIYPDVFKKLQESKFLKNYEEKLFKLYSSNNSDKAENINLKVKGFIENGFVAVQMLGDKSYESTCIRKDKAEFKFNQRLEINKKIAENAAK